MHRTFMVAGALAGFLGVALGAFGAHALKAQLSVQMREVFQTGVHYQTLHAVVLLFVALEARRLQSVERSEGSARIAAAGWLFVTGIVIFSGSLYTLALTGLKWFGAIAPIGGVCFLGGWLLLFLAAISKQSPNT